MILRAMCAVAGLRCLHACKMREKERRDEKEGKGKRERERDEKERRGKRARYNGCRHSCATAERTEKKRETKKKPVSQPASHRITSQSIVRPVNKKVRD